MAALIRRRRPQPSRLGRIHSQPQIRALRASAAQLDLSRRDAATPMILGVRQDWQPRAWEYYGQVGELRYANKFRGNAARRTRFIPGIYMPEEGKPVPIDDSDETRYAAVAHEGIARLGSPDAVAGLARDTMENFGITGECYLIGRTDGAGPAQREVWEIRSTSAVTVKDGRPVIREYPGSRDFLTLEPTDLIARMWIPDPEYRSLADSPVRVAIETCLEELVLLGKDIRASAASRLALNGILALPDSLSIIGGTEPGDDSLEDDPFMADLIAAATEAIRNPGSAAAALPLMLRGPAESIAAIQQIQLSRPESDNSKKRAEALSRLASTLDLPPEIMSGLGGMNHWCVDTDTEILTRSGWVREDQLEIGDTVLTLNHETGLPEWQPVQDIYRADVVDEPMMALFDSRHSSYTTLAHRWPIIRDGARAWTTSAELLPTDRILLCDEAGDTAELHVKDVGRLEMRYSGVVWCPTTPAGTWIARREGTVYVTGNSAWAITDSMWRDHLEPGIQDVVSAWTDAFYRPYLLEAGVPPEIADRMVIWYDPTDVIVKADRSQAATEAWDRGEISGAAYRDHIGFRDEEAPDEAETLRRAALKGLFDPPTAVAILTGKPIPEPAPAIEPATVVDDEVVDAEPVEEDAPNGGTPPETSPTDDLPDAAAMRRRVLAATRRRPAIATPAPLVAAGHITADEALAISQRLSTIDTQLREKIRGSAEASVKRALERAGARLVSKGRKDATVAAAVADIPAWAVPARLGPTLVAAIDDVDETGLLATVLGELESLWHRFVTAASDLALRQAARLVGMDVNEAYGVLDGKFRADRASGWVFLSERLTDVARAALLLDPSEAIAAGRLVSPSVARAAIAVAGGFDTPTSRGINAETLLPVDRGEHFGGIGTGTTIKEFAESRGAAVERLQWIHGFSERAFEPHLALDRKFFDSWDDQVLRAPEGADFMGPHMRPGDHKGCSCDMVLVWTPPPAPQGETQ